MKVFKLPLYSDLSPKQRQWVHAGLGGLTFVALYFLVSALIGGDPMAPSRSTPSAPSIRTLGAVPGESVDPQAAWIGGAGKAITTLQADVQAQQQKQDKVNESLLRELEALRQRTGASMADARADIGAASAAPGAPSATEAPDPARLGRAGRVEPGGTLGGERFPKLGSGGPASGLPPPQRLAAQSAGYPPGLPNGADAPAAVGAMDPPIGVIKVSLAPAGTATPNGKASVTPVGGALTAPRRIDTFLPVSFTRAVLLGGMDAPTGGQAQRDPVPVLLKLTDNAVLPNEYRSAVKDCFVVADGFGDVSAERAYIRTQLLSCVLKNGQSLEVPIKGSVFGEDGKNGLRGRLITKQGAILSNALLSGIAAGIGQGFAASTQITSVSPLGTTVSNSNATQDILKSGLGTGVGRAMDRLAQYYINLAERTFPVIEIDAGRAVDIVITTGVTLDGALAVSSEGSSALASRTINRSEMLNAVNEVADD